MADPVLRAGFSSDGTDMIPPGVPVGEMIETENGGTSLAVQGLRLCLPVQEAWVRSLVGELRSHMPWGAAKNLKKKKKMTLKS